MYRYSRQYGYTDIFMAKPLRLPNKKLVAFDDETIGAIEAWRKKQSPIPSEPEAIRRLVKQALGKPKK